MKSMFGLLILCSVVAVAVPAFGDDQQKAQKEMTRITAMAADFDGRRVVNVTLADIYKVSRPSLVELRTKTGLNYGGVFLAEELMQKGMTSDDLLAKLKSGSIIADIANQQHVEWKSVTEDAKKLNKMVDDNLYAFFLGKKATEAQDAADRYQVNYDGVKADADISQKDISTAQERYLRWRDRAQSAQHKNHTLSTGDERVAYSDHVSNGGPNGTSIPVTMGGTQR